nr:fused MFS/spermidine synthase [Kofleriaceae bacterium]
MNRILVGCIAVSGACGLVYETAWMRELALVFGATTAANAAVLAIFMAGLGAGAAWFGKRVDAHPAPLMLYARLEGAIAVTAAATPLLWIAVRWAYGATGGSATLGPIGASVLRLVLAAIVLGGPTFAMGGTLPAVVRAVSTADARPDARGSVLAALYGANALGAVLGALVGTFATFELIGIRLTLWGACACNAVVAALVVAIARRARATAKPAAVEVEPEPEAASPPPRWLQVAAFATGFAFFLVELVWYRMLGPILGGSTFTFGLILAGVLVGIGVGSLAYRFPGAARRPTARGFAIACGAQAVAVLVPLALGDRIAVLAIVLHQWASAGFGALCAGWAIVVAIVVVPAAIVAGVQFPMLVALAARSRARIGTDVGRIYAVNTAGAIAGALAGGFGMLSLLGAVLAWRVAGALSIALAALALANTAGVAARAVAAIPAALAVALLTAGGPTAAWRDSPIGAGRAQAAIASPAKLDAWLAAQRRLTIWEHDGVESAIALRAESGIALLVNGKSDGAAIQDAPTQTMLGILPALLHREPRRALVIGFGTGTTAGWLADVPGIERVDVVEIEPAVLRAGVLFGAVNRHALDNPKVHVITGDAREYLLATGEHYDIICSEPSNPYRSGVGSMYAREYYAAARRALGDDGLFVQWLQSYEVDDTTVASVYATMTSELPHVQTWETLPGDLLLVASAAPIVLEPQAVRTRIATEPFATAMLRIWHVADAEGVFAHLLGDDALATTVATLGELSTDDHPVVEFGFARTAGDSGLFTHGELIDVTRAVHAIPQELRGLDWTRVVTERYRDDVEDGRTPPPKLPAESTQLLAVVAPWERDQLDAAYRAYVAAPFEPRDPYEQLVAASTATAGADVRADAIIEQLPPALATEQAMLRAVRAATTGKLDAATFAFADAVERFRVDPYPPDPIVSQFLAAAMTIARGDRDHGRVVFELLEAPFAARAAEVQRVALRMRLAEVVDFDGLCARALAPLEPDPPVEVGVMSLRARCYADIHDPRADRARADLEALAERSEALVDLLGLGSDTGSAAH